jgi:hypothetical protein
VARAFQPAPSVQTLTIESSSRQILPVGSLLEQECPRHIFIGDGLPAWIPFVVEIARE